MGQCLRFEPAIIDALHGLVDHEACCSILLLGDDASALMEALPASPRPPERHVLQPAGQPPTFSLESLGRFDLALAAATLFTQPKHEIERVLARLRDVQARAVCLYWRPEWSDTCSKHDLLAFAMRRVDTGGEDATGHLFLYDIRTYKDTPQWLSPQHWAHPQRWNKERW